MTNDADRLAAVLRDRYTIGRTLGHGGMATVHHAHDLRHDRQVALKVLRPELASALGAERFLREITVTARLDHPGILPLLDSGAADGLLYYVMPYVEGESLRARLTREKQLPVDEALRIAREVGDALAYAHAHGIVHRDIKPENILLSDGHARVGDFGIARAVVSAGGDTLTDTGIVIGTLAYMSPEQAAGGDDVDGRSDIYSLGCVLYEMLAGYRPFDGPTPQALLARKSLDTPASLRVIRPRVPEPVERAVFKALSPIPADRFSTAADFVSRVARRDSGSSGDRPAPWRRQRILGLAALVAIAAIPAGVLIARSRAAVPPVEVDATRIAVFPFVVRDSLLADLSEGLMDHVSQQIDGIGVIRRVDPYLIMSRLADARITEVTDLRLARRIARELGAGRFVLGRVVRSGPRVKILASLYREDSRAGPEHAFSYETRSDSTFASFNLLAGDLMKHLPTGAGTWPGEDGGDATTPFEALRAYNRGETLMRQSHQTEAADAFGEALAFDSTFALAWLRLALAEEYRLYDSSSVAAIDRAVRYADRLSTRDRTLARAMHANYHGDGAEAERIAQELASAYPLYGEAWYQVAAAQLWYGWQRGRSPTHAGPALNHALALDPEHRQSMHLLTFVAAHERNLARAESLQLRAWRLRWSLPPGEGGALRAFLDSGPSFNHSKVTLLVYSTAGYTDRLVDAARIAGLLIDAKGRPREIWSHGHLLTGLVEAAGGRWTGVQRALGAADAAEAGVGVLERGWIAALPFLGVADSVRRALRDSLAAWEPPASYLALPRGRVERRFPFIGLLLTPPWLVPHARHYVLGLLSAGLGDAAAATRYAGMLRTAAEPSDSIGLLGDLSREVLALNLMRRGDTTAALSLLERSSLRVATRLQVFESMYHTRPLTRFLRAEALTAAGRDAEALGWYEAFPMLDPAFVLHAWANLRQGEIHERLGNPRRAEWHYARFVARWAHADAQYQPLVKAIRQRVERLRRESR